MSADVAIHIDKLNKWYGAYHALRDIDLTVKKGERIVICGPSGSGKSTMIRCVNALETFQSGRIIVDDTELTSDLKNIDQIRSEVALVHRADCSRSGDLVASEDPHCLRLGRSYHTI